jgi:CubicO group peptidase (beta-lactamase class C family)
MRCQEFFQGLASAYPSFAPWTTPAYSNIAFQLLAYALENITGRSFTDSLQSKVVGPLGLNATYYAWAPQSVGIIPREAGSTGWFDYLGDESP